MPVESKKGMSRRAYRGKESGMSGTQGTLKGRPLLIAQRCIQQEETRGSTMTWIRDQVRLKRHREVSQGFIYVLGSRSDTESESKYSTWYEGGT